MAKEAKEIKPKDKAELALEKAVFGDEDGFEQGLRALDLDEEYSDLESSSGDEGEGLGDEDPELIQDDDLFTLDEGELDEESGEGNEIENGGEDSVQIEEDSDDDAWYDSDDNRLQVSLNSVEKLKKLRTSMQDDHIDGREYLRRLRARYNMIYPIPQWARPQKDDIEDSDLELSDDDDLARPDPLAQLLKSTTSYISTKASKALPPTQISITRMKDANHAAVAKSAVQTLNFHPSHPLLLASGYDRTLRLFHIDGNANPVATTLHVRETPFQTAQFHPDGKRVFAAGRRRYMYMWDIEAGDVTKISRMYGHEQTQRSMENFKISQCGRFVGLVGSGGWLNVLSATNGQWVGGAKIEGIIADFVWFDEGRHALIVNTGGEVWQWSSEQKQFVNRWKAEGGIGTTTIAISSNNRWVALGSSNGIVDVFDLQNMEVSMKMSDEEVVTYKPHAVLEQLVTTISSLGFSSDSQLLYMASRAKRDALRLVHVPSFTAYQNWPTAGTPLGRVTSVAFTPGNEMLCTANESGNARLWKLAHYTS